MPSRNIIRFFSHNTYYHVYNRKANSLMFRDELDYLYFTMLFDRYLGTKIYTRSDGLAYQKLNELVEINAFCLMPTHFHLMIFTKDKDGLKKLLTAILTSHSMYYNQKYSTRGKVFESVYKAKAITTEAYLLHISRYIHMNPGNWETYKHSSFSSYFGYSPSWLNADRILQLFNTKINYQQFLYDYENFRKEKDYIKFFTAES